VQPRSLRGTSIAWWLVLVCAFGVRAWNALTGPLLWGYDAPGHASYIFYLDRYGFLPFAHQGWGYFHPPLHYLVGWLLTGFGDADVLLRGLGLFGSLLSLAIAGLAARVVRWTAPEQPALACVAFAAIAFLPVHLYASPMIGNELTCAFFGAAAVTALIANECRSTAVWRLDAAVGLLLGLALLSKFTGATYLAAAVASIAVRPIHTAGVGAWQRAGRRVILVVVACGFVAGPFYARNVAEYGTPFRMNRDYDLTASVEAQQPPGFRTWRDFVNLPPRLFTDPRPGAPHLLHSVWGTAYVNAWTDTRAMWNRLPEPAAERVERSRLAMIGAGLPVTLLALWGAGLAVRDVRRGRRRAAYVPLLLLAAATLAAFALFAMRVPRVSALKATYLFGLSIPWGVFVARGVETLGARPGRRIALLASLSAIALASALVYTVGVVLPRRPDHRSLGAVHWLLGDSQSARAFFESSMILRQFTGSTASGFSGVGSRWTHSGKASKKRTRGQGKGKGRSGSRYS